MRPINITILFFGALLVQIVIGEEINEHGVNDAMDMNTIPQKSEIGRQLENRLIENGDTNYASAERCCFDSVLIVAGFQNDTFCQGFYKAVVARLEEDAKL